MELIDNSATLVIAGNWNPSILNPIWVAREALELQPDNTFQATINYINTSVGQLISYEFEGLKYVANYDQVVFHFNPNDLDQCNKTTLTASRILRLLNHTPITAFGLNMSYRIANPSQKLLRSFESSSLILEADIDNLTDIVKRSWGTTVNYDGYLLNVNSVLEAGAVILSFNLHHEITNALRGAELLEQINLFANSRNLIESIANSIVNGDE